MVMRRLCIIVGGMAIVAILPWPSFYYQLLRWLVFASGVIVAFGFYQSKFQGWALTFGAIAILFNPLLPVYLYQKSLWVGVDLLVGIVFFLAAYSKKK